LSFTADPRFFLRFLDEANKLPGVRAWKSAIIDELRLQLGAQFLDIGCGMGADALDLAALDRRSDPQRHQPQHCSDV
jgi:ubiquinone/menaquinone biosynthesis C-methylase UbiE